MLVYVLNKDGKPLMPCKQAKARKLLKDSKAKVVKRTPFTIQLNWDCENNVQPVILGVDTGYKKMGVSAVSKDKELFDSEVELRTDIPKLLSEKKQYRRTRRNRLWYRKSRFFNRVKSKKKSWLAPSVEHRLNEHIKMVNLVKSILPVSSLVASAAAFDIQRLKNPEILGIEYQNGEQKDFWNVREYVLYRDGHKCSRCGKTNTVLNVHHIIARAGGGTDRPDNLITLCEACHKAYHEGRLELKIKNNKGFKAETIMSILRWKIVNRLIELGNIVGVTYGYITKSARIALGLPKSHINDAFCIAGGTVQKRTGNNYFIKFVRKCNRSLFKANLLKGGKRKVNTIKRAFGFARRDKVIYGKTECFIHGLRSSGYFDIRSLTGEKINASAKYANLRLIESFKTWRIALLPALTDGVSEL
ncbi:MAG: RNA-guided endonuclease IscB [Deltaproteobacteria bacterium]|nr:RNA-guided endonuclease IscB [Deltaproteobacteria bacterium]